MISRNTSLVKFLKGCRQLLYMIARPEKASLKQKWMSSSQSELSNRLEEWPQTKMSY